MSQSEQDEFIKQKTNIVNEYKKKQEQLINEQYKLSDDKNIMAEKQRIKSLIEVSENHSKLEFDKNQRNKKFNPSIKNINRGSTPSKDKPKTPIIPDKNENNNFLSVNNNNKNGQNNTFLGLIDASESQYITNNDQTVSPKNQGFQLKEQDEKSPISSNHNIDFKPVQIRQYNGVLGQDVDEDTLEQNTAQVFGKIEPYVYKPISRSQSPTREIIQNHEQMNTSPDNSTKLNKSYNISKQKNGQNNSFLQKSKYSLFQQSNNNSTHIQNNNSNPYIIQDPHHNQSVSFPAKNDSPQKLEQIDKSQQIQQQQKQIKNQNDIQQQQPITINYQNEIIPQKLVSKASVEDADNYQLQQKLNEKQAIQQNQQIQPIQQQQQYQGRNQQNIEMQNVFQENQQQQQSNQMANYYGEKSPSIQQSGPQNNLQTFGEYDNQKLQQSMDPMSISLQKNQKINDRGDQYYGSNIIEDNNQQEQNLNSIQEDTKENISTIQNNSGSHIGLSSPYSNNLKLQQNMQIIPQNKQFSSNNSKIPIQSNQQYQNQQQYVPKIQKQQQYQQQQQFQQQQYQQQYNQEQIFEQQQQEQQQQYQQKQQQYQGQQQNQKQQQQQQQQQLIKQQQQQPIINNQQNQTNNNQKGLQQYKNQQNQQFTVDTFQQNQSQNYPIKVQDQSQLIKQADNQIYIQQNQQKSSYIQLQDQNSQTALKQIQPQQQQYDKDMFKTEIYNTNSSFNQQNQQFNDTNNFTVQNKYDATKEVFSSLLQLSNLDIPFQSLIKMKVYTLQNSNPIDIDWSFESILFSNIPLSPNIFQGSCFYKENDNNTTHERKSTFLSYNYNASNSNKDFFKDIHFLYQINKEFRQNRENTPVPILLSLPIAFEIQKNQIEIILETSSFITMTEMIKKRRRDSGQAYSENELAFIFHSILRSLEVLEKKGILHSQLTPDNIIFCVESGSYKIHNFSQSQTFSVSDKNKYKRQQQQYSIFYKSPYISEQTKQMVDSKIQFSSTPFHSERYALAVTFFCIQQIIEPNETNINVINRATKLLQEKENPNLVSTQLIQYLFNSSYQQNYDSNEFWSGVFEILDRIQHVQPDDESVALQKSTLTPNNLNKPQYKSEEQLKLIADQYYITFQFQKGLEYYILLLKMQQQKYGLNDERLIPTLSKIWKIYFSNNDFENSYIYCNQYTTLARNNYYKLKQEQSQTKQNQLIDKSNQSNLENNQSLSSFNKLQRSLVTDFNLSGQLKWQLEKQLEAIQDYEMALELQIEIYGENEYNVIKNLNNIGVYYSNLNDLDKAIEIISKAVEKMEQQNITDHLYTSALYNLGNLLSDNGQIEQALPYLIKSYQIKKKTLGNNQDVGKLAHLIGTLHFQLKNYQESLQYLEEAVVICSKFVEQDDSEFIKYKKNLIVSQIKNNQHTQANIQIESIISALETSQFKTFQETPGQIYYEFGQFFEKILKYDHALICYSKCVNYCQEMEISNADPQFTSCLKRINSLKAKLNISNQQQDSTIKQTSAIKQGQQQDSTIKQASVIKQDQNNNLQQNQNVKGQTDSTIRQQQQEQLKQQSNLQQQQQQDQQQILQQQQQQQKILQQQQQEQQKKEQQQKQQQQQQQPQQSQQQQQQQQKLQDQQLQQQQQGIEVKKEQKKEKKSDKTGQQSELNNEKDANNSKIGINAINAQDQQKQQQQISQQDNAQKNTTVKQEQQNKIINSSLPEQSIINQSTPFGNTQLPQQSNINQKPEEQLQNQKKSEIKNKLENDNKSSQNQQPPINQQISNTNKKQTEDNNNSIIVGNNDKQQDQSNKNKNIALENQNNLKSNININQLENKDKQLTDSKKEQPNQNNTTVKDINNNSQVKNTQANKKNEQTNKKDDAIIGQSQSKIADQDNNSMLNSINGITPTPQIPQSQSKSNVASIPKLEHLTSIPDNINNNTSQLKQNY